MSATGKRAASVADLSAGAGDDGLGIPIPGFPARREAREDALAVLYEMEITGYDTRRVLARRGVPLSGYAVEIATGVQRWRQARGDAGIDGVLRRHLVDWRLERMPVLDRSLARIAVWELIHRPDVPTGVVLSEAVALATMYCGAESPRFLNGVLRAVADAARDAEPPGEMRTAG